MKPIDKAAVERLIAQVFDGQGAVERLTFRHSKDGRVTVTAYGREPDKPLTYQNNR